MDLKLKINLSETDYLNMNLFWAFKSPYGKKDILKIRILITAIYLVAIVVSLIGGGFSSSAFIGIIPYVILLVLFQVFLKAFWKGIIKGNIKAMKKKGKLPFSEYSEIEFRDEYFIETTLYNKSEVKYSAIEKISIVSDASDKVIYLHVSNVSGYILPFSAFEAEAQQEEFIAFIKTKCEKVYTY